MRNFFLKLKLNRAIHHPSRKRVAHNLRTAKTIAILFDASEQIFCQHIKEWSAAIENSGKHIQLMGFIAHPQATDNLGFPWYSSKDFTLTGRCKNDALDRFVSSKPHLLVSVNPKDLLPISILAAMSNAEMKIGSPSAWNNDYDLLLEVPENKNIKYFLEQLQFYLDKINLANEPSRTV
jgi:hypothetical protein